LSDRLTEPTAESTKKRAVISGRKRRRFPFKRKLEIIDDVLRRQTSVHLKGKKITRNTAIRLVSEDTGIALLTISKWIKDQNNIRECAASKDKGSRKARYNRSWLRDLRHLEEVLAREVRKRRKLGTMCFLQHIAIHSWHLGIFVGLKVGRTWALSTARRLRQMPSVVKPENVEHIQLSYGWYYHGFLPRNEFSIRRGNNRKKADTASLKPTIYQFHQTLQKRNEGREILPSSIFNFDEVLFAQWDN